MSNNDQVQPQGAGKAAQPSNQGAVGSGAVVSPAPRARKPFTASHFQIHTWGATGISYYFQYQLFALVGVIFNLGFGMDPRLIGWALFFPRLIDSFLDPIIGHFSDIIRTPLGRRRPFMIVCSILAAGLGWLLWQANPAWPWWGQFTYLCLLVTAYFIVVMTFELTRNALSYELSDDYNIRSTIMTIASFWSALPQVLGGAAVYYFVVKLETGYNLAVGFPAFRVGWLFGLNAWLGAAGILSFLIGYVTLRSRSSRTRWAVGVVACVILLAGPPAVLVALHGPQAAKAMLHTWNTQDRKVAVTPTTAASAPATRAAGAETAASAPATMAVATTAAAEMPATTQGATSTRPVPTSMAAATTGPTTACASTGPAAGMTPVPITPAAAGTLKWGLDYSGYTFFTVHLPNLGSKIAGIRAISLIVGIIIIVFAIIPIIFMKERFQNYNTKHVSLWKAFKATFRNKPFIVMILLRLAQTLGSVLYSTMSMYIIIYGVCYGDQAQYSAVMSYGGALLGLFFIVLIWPLAAPLTKLIGKRWGLILGFAAPLASSILAPFLIRPGWIWIILGVNFFWMPFGVIQGMFVESIKPDICDVDELESGERREGLYSAVYSFINKLEISVVMLISGYLLVWAGFDAKAASHNIVPPHAVIIRMMWLAFTPLIFFNIVGLILTFFNPLTPAVMAKVHEELEERRSAGGITTDPR